MEFFKSIKITPSITRITDLTQVHMFLAEGSKRALLIDTGTGLGDLKAYVETLTDKPLTVVLTHGHCDHAGGAGCFAQVYLNPLDFSLVREHASRPMREGYAEYMLGENYPLIKAEDYAPAYAGDYLELKEGAGFDLGDLSVEAVPIPGHTQGMTGFLFREERLFLCGDAFNTFTFMFDKEAACVEALRDKLLDVQKMEPLFDRLILSHGDDLFIEKGLIESCIDVCEKVMTGKDDAVPFEFLGSPGWIAMKTDENNKRLDGGLGNIVYHKDKIRNPGQADGRRVSP